MREYGGTLLCVCLFGTLVRMLSPEGDMKRYVGLVAAFCVILTVAKPLASPSEDGGIHAFFEQWMSRETESLENYAEIYDHTLLDTSGRLIGDHIKSLILQEFSLEEESITAKGEIALKNGTHRLDRVILYLHKSTLSADPRDLTDFVSQRFDCPCVAIYDINDEKS